MDMELETTSGNDLAIAKRETDQAVALASHWAKQLMAVVEECDLAKNIGGKKYLQVEAWQLIAQFAHVEVMTDWIKPWSDDTAEGPKLLGYWARAKVLKNGVEIASGESSCGFDAFPCKGKQGSEMHKAARSAAETWAISKAMRNKFGFVAKIAGFEPTPADEMDEGERREAKQEERKQAEKQYRERKAESSGMVRKLGDAMLDYFGGNLEMAADALYNLTGKRKISELNDLQATEAYNKFQKQYVEADKARAAGGR